MRFFGIALIIAVSVTLLFMGAIKLLDPTEIMVSPNKTISGDNGQVHVGVSDSVSVSIVRQRWYGKIEVKQINGLENEYLLINNLKQPLRLQGINLRGYYIAYFILMLSLIITSSVLELKKMMEGEQWETNYMQ